MKRKKHTKAPEKQKPVYNYDDRIAILRYWDDHDMDVEMTMGRFNVARSTLFLWKKKFWDEMMEMKDAKLTGVEDAEREKQASVIVPVVNQKKIDKVKTKATTATEQIFDLILFKLEREMEFMKKNPEKFGNIKIFELSKLLDIAASYVIPKATKAEEQGAFANMDKKYSQLTQYIQNNFLANTQDDGKKKDTVKGNGRFLTIYPAGTGGGGDGDNEPPIQE